MLHVRRVRSPKPSMSTPIYLHDLIETRVVDEDIGVQRYRELRALDAYILVNDARLNQVVKIDCCDLLPCYKRML